MLPSLRHQAKNLLILSMIGVFFACGSDEKTADELFEGVEFLEKGKEPAPRMAPLTSVPVSEFLLDEVRLVKGTGERSSVNIAQNGDFESWSGGLPTAWIVAGSPQITQGDDAKSGKFAVTIQTKATADQGIYQGKIEISPDTEYTLSFHYKVNSGQFLLRIDDNGANLLQGRLRATKWTQHKETVKTSVNAKMLTFYMRSGR